MGTALGLRIGYVDSVVDMLISEMYIKRWV